MQSIKLGLKALVIARVATQEQVVWWGEIQIYLKEVYSRRGRADRRDRKETLPGELAQ